MATLIPILAGNRFAFMHMGTVGAGLGGRFLIDSNVRQVDLRLTMPDTRTPTIMWLWYETFGTPGVLRLRLCQPLASDPLQPDLATGAAIAFNPQAAGAPGWQAIAIPPQPAPFAVGLPIHIVIERDSGLFDAGNRVEIISTRSRPPLPFVPQNSANSSDAVSPVDVTIETLYSADSSLSKNLLEARDGNAHFPPVVVVECSSGLPFGQPYNVHTETSIYGQVRAGCMVALPVDCEVNFLALWARGGGTGGALKPLDNLYCEIIQQDRATGTRMRVGPRVQIADKTHKLFKNRSHWFAGFLGKSLTLKSRDTHTYFFMLSSPGCKLTTADDAWIFTLDQSTCPVSNAPTWLFNRARGASGAGNDVSITPSPFATDTGLILLNAADTSLACNDEITQCEDVVNFPGVFAMKAAANAIVTIRLLVRNIGRHTGTGGEIWGRIVDADSGAILQPTILYPAIDQNDEVEQPMSLQMPASGDLHLRYEMGHVEPPGAGLAGTLVIDDYSPQTIRQA